MFRAPLPAVAHLQPPDLSLDRWHPDDFHHRKSPAALSVVIAGDADVSGALDVGGGLTVDNDGSTVLTVDRATSDGTIIDLQKSGSSVGSIGAYKGKRAAQKTALKVNVIEMQEKN